MIYYLKNTSGETVALDDLGIILQNGDYIEIDSNDVSGWLTPSLATALTTQSELILSTTIENNYGDMEPADAIKTLTPVSMNTDGNPMGVTFTQVAQADQITDITAYEAEELTDGSDTELHVHDNRYYSKLDLTTPEKAVINWKNIVDVPNLGSPSWQASVQCKIEYVSNFEPSSGQYYLNLSDNILYKNDGNGYWETVEGVNKGYRVLNKNTYNLHEFHSGEWKVLEPEPNWTVLVEDDGDGKAAQYVYNGKEWIKVADADWGNHSSLSGRADADSHPASAISYNPSGTVFSGKNLQSILLEINTHVSAGKIILLTKEVHVAAEGDDRNGTGSIAFPYKSLKKAFTAALGSTPTTIIMHTGTYIEAQPISITDGITLQGFAPGTVIIDSDIDFSGKGDISNINFTKQVNIAGTRNFISCSFANVIFANNVGNLQDITAEDLTADSSDLTLSNCKITSVQYNSGTVTVVSGSIESFITKEETVIYWGLAQVGACEFKGEFHPINLAKYIAYDGSISGINADNVQEAITETKQAAGGAQAALDTHKEDQSNPHRVNLIQTIALDPVTDITPGEFETLSDGSIADMLHYHTALRTAYNPIELEEVDVQNAIDYLARNYMVYPKNVIYVAKNGSDVPLPKGHRGSAGAPYLTINSALERIDQNGDNSITLPYIIWVGPGVYTERILLNDTNFKNIIFLGNSSIINPPDNKESILTSMYFNQNLERAEFHNFSFKSQVSITSEVDKTNLFRDKLYFKNCSLQSIELNGVINVEFENCHYLAVNITNVTSVTFKKCIQDKKMTAIYSEGPKPEHLQYNDIYIYDSTIYWIDAYDHNVIHMYNGSLENGRIYCDIYTYCTKYNIKQVELKDAGKWINEDIAYRNQFFDTYGVYETLNKITLNIQDRFTKADINNIMSDFNTAIYANFYTKNEIDNSFYTKTDINTNYYNKTETAEKYYNKTEIDKQLRSVNIILGIIQEPKEVDELGNEIIEENDDTNIFMENFKKVLFNDINDLLNNLVVDFSEYYTITDVDKMFEEKFEGYFTKSQMIEFINNVNTRFTTYYNRVESDALFKNIYDNYYTREWTDAKVAELNAIYNNYYNIPVMDLKISELYKAISDTVYTAVSEIHNFFDTTAYTKTVMDVKLADIIAMFDNYYTKPEWHQLFYTKPELDAIIDKIVASHMYTPEQVDEFFTHYYTKPETDTLLAAINAHITQLESNVYTKTETNIRNTALNDKITSVINAVYTKIEVNAITQDIINRFSNYYDKATIEWKFAQLTFMRAEDYFTKTEIGEMFVASKVSLDNYYTKFEVDTIVSSLRIPSTYETKTDAITKYNDLNSKITNTNTALNQTNSLVDSINARLLALESDNVVDGGYSDLELEEWDGGTSSS
jgi:hypothetical protein